MMDYLRGSGPVNPGFIDYFLSFFCSSLTPSPQMKVSGFIKDVNDIILLSIAIFPLEDALVKLGRSGSHR